MIEDLYFVFGGIELDGNCIAGVCHGVLEAMMLWCLGSLEAHKLGL